MAIWPESILIGQNLFYNNRNLVHPYASKLRAQKITLLHYQLHDFKNNIKDNTNNLFM